VRNSWRRIAGLILILAVVVGCAADRLHRDGLTAIERGDYESGVALLNQAVQNNPHNMTFRLDLQARRDAAIQQLIAIADTARGAHQLEVAAQDYKRVLALDPNNDRAKRSLAGLEGDARHGRSSLRRAGLRAQGLRRGRSELRGVRSEDPGYGPAQDLATAINTARGPITVAPRLKTRDNHKVTLQLRDAPTKMVFEVLSRETGINFILDRTSRATPRPPSSCRTYRSSRRSTWCSTRTRWRGRSSPTTWC